MNASGGGAPRRCLDVNTTPATETPSAPLRRRRPPRAAVAVCALAMASLVAVGVLSLPGPGHAVGGGLHAWPARAQAEFGAASPVQATREPGIRPRTAPLDGPRWRAIVIHESGTPAGDMASLERRHFQAGRAGLGFHFVVGNGQGMEDGLVGVGYRWDRQLPGAHAPAQWRASARGGMLDGAGLNDSAIAICVIGNSDRRPWSDRQQRETANLVRALQRECGIPDEAVHAARDLSSPVPAARVGRRPGVAQVGP